MNSKAVLIGVEVVVAAISGLAIFLGMSKCSNNFQNQSSGMNGNTTGENCQSGKEDLNVGNTIVGALRNSQNSCRNAAGLLSALGDVAEKSMILFGKVPEGYGRNNRGYDVPGGNIRLRRRSPYIIEAVGDGDIYNDNYDNHYL